MTDHHRSQWQKCDTSNKQLIEVLLVTIDYQSETISS